MTEIRILLADEHAVMRKALRLAIERRPGLNIVAEAVTTGEAVELAGAMSPQVAIVDIALPRLNGVEISRCIVDRSPATAVVILSGHSDESYVLGALRAGARAYLLKECAATDLVRAIESVVRGGHFFSPAIRRHLSQDATVPGGENGYRQLTPGEREVFLGLAEGSSDLEIANSLQLSLVTVGERKGAILRKLGLASIPDLVFYALRSGICGSL